MPRYVPMILRLVFLGWSIRSIIGDKGPSLRVIQAKLLLFCNDLHITL